MNRSLSLVFLVVGLALGIYGLFALDSIGSSFSRFFTGAPTDKTIWLLLVGGVCVVIGLGGLVRRST